MPTHDALWADWIDDLCLAVRLWQGGQAVTLRLIPPDDLRLAQRLHIGLAQIPHLTLAHAAEPLADPPRLTLCLAPPPGEMRPQILGQELFFAPLTALSDPSAHAAQLHQWLAHLAGAGYLYLGAEGLPWPQPGFCLRQVHGSAPQALAALGLRLARQDHALGQVYAQSVVHDRARALLLHQTVADQARIAQLQQRVDQQARDLHEWSALQHTPGFKLMKQAQRLRAAVTPPHSRRERLLEMALGWLSIYQQRGMSGLGRHLRGEMGWRSRALTSRWRRQGLQPVALEPVAQRPPVQPHRESVDIVICIHNALDDVRRCLESVVSHTPQPCRLILVDDGSDPPTAGYLQDFAQAHAHAELLRSQTATGYTFAANRGLRHSTGEFVALLNSDTIVTQGWLDRMIACAQAGDEGGRPIGMVGPLSNTASWQSIPDYAEGGDWAANPLPPGLSLAEWAEAVAQESARLYPPMPLLNGFCLLIRRALMEEIGYFDEDHFGAGYGEENDYVLRARKAGWPLALADDAYIYHAQSRSYSHERRKALSDRAGQSLAAKHGQPLIDDSVHYAMFAPALEGIRARAAVLPERLALHRQGRERFAGKRLLIALPVDSPGGGANVVIHGSLAMQRMGVEVSFFNTHSRRAGFERGYPELTIPVRYGNESDLLHMGREFDAVIATYYLSVYWMQPLAHLPTPQRPALGYYVQDYEALFFPDDHPEHEVARASYGLIPEMRAFTKTAWNQRTVAAATGVTPAVIGPCFDLDLFRPRPRGALGLRTGQSGERPVHVVAMVRPHSPRRSPDLTMRLLRDLYLRFGRRVRITIFGVDQQDPGLAHLPQDFPCRSAGVIDPPRIAGLLADADIFADFSTYQAMGLTAMEAMACGCAVIVPVHGGSTSFAAHEENALIVDTASAEACWHALVRLVQDDDLRQRLGRNAIRSVCRFHPEQAAFNILSLLLGESPEEGQ